VSSLNLEAFHYSIFTLLLLLPPSRPIYLPQHLIFRHFGSVFFLNVRDQVSIPYKTAGNPTSSVYFGLHVSWHKTCTQILRTERWQSLLHLACSQSLYAYKCEWKKAASQPRHNVPLLTLTTNTCQSMRDCGTLQIPGATIAIQSKW